jgi:hypothetical protein
VATTAFVAASTRLRLAGNTTYFVSNSGNDVTGNGTSGNPWATLQKAINFVVTNVDISGFVVTVQMIDGSYAGFSVNQPYVGGAGGNVVVQGNSVTPSNTLVTSAVQCDTGGEVSIQNMKITSSVHCLNVGQDAVVLVGTGIIFGTAGGNHVNNGIGIVRFGTSYIIAGSAVGFHWASQSNGLISVNSGSVITLTGAPSFNTFAIATECGVIACNGITFSGTATGVRYSVTANGVIATGTGNPNFLPGNASGTASSGGQYN